MTPTSPCRRDLFKGAAAITAAAAVGTVTAFTARRAHAQTAPALS
jgi:hypothetical protein